ncbi:MAG: amidase, partial [Acidobacteriota bacterium]
MLRKRKLSPVELTDFYLQRIEQSQPALNAFITITAEKAREEARRAEGEIAKGHYRGPLHGIPLSYKDLIATGGVATTAGSKVLAANIPPHDAAAVERLATAGAIGLGKTNLHEFAFGITSNNEHFGPVRNPWNPEMIPGGSSGGSAVAVAAGLCAASIGSDTGGSIRIPASACGCVGLKPTYGRVNLKGIIPLSWSMDHLGPIAQSAGDAAHLLDVLLEPIQGHAAGNAPPPDGYAAAVPHSQAALSLGISSRWMEDGVHPEVRRTVGSAIKSLEERWGPAREIEFPYQEHLAMLGTVIAFAEAASYHEDWLRTRPEDYGHEVRTRLRLGKL